MEYYLIYYLIAVSLLGVFVTVYDKHAAISGKRRIREKVLFLYALLGAALSMYITMKIIRHKTLHKSFMIGFPLIAITHIIIIIYYYFFFNKF